MAAPATHAHGIDISHWAGQYAPVVRPVDFVICKASEGTGGTITEADGYTYHTFTSNGTFKAPIMGSGFFFFFK